MQFMTLQERQLWYVRIKNKNTINADVWHCGHYKKTRGELILLIHVITNPQYATKSKLANFSVKATVKVTRSLTLVSFEMISLD